MYLVRWSAHKVGLEATQTSHSSTIFFGYFCPRSMYEERFCVVDAPLNCRIDPQPLLLSVVSFCPVNFLSASAKSGCLVHELSTSSPSSSRDTVLPQSVIVNGLPSSASVNFLLRLKDSRVHQVVRVRDRTWVKLVCSHPPT